MLSALALSGCEVDTDLINSYLLKMLVCLYFRDGSDDFVRAEVSHLYLALIKNEECARNNEDTELTRVTKYASSQVFEFDVIQQTFIFVCHPYCNYTVLV